MWRCRSNLKWNNLGRSKRHTLKGFVTAITSEHEIFSKRATRYQKLVDVKVWPNLPCWRPQLSYVCMLSCLFNASPSLQILFSIIYYNRNGVSWWWPEAFVVYIRYVALLWALATLAIGSGLNCRIRWTDVRHKDCHFKFQHRSSDGKVMRSKWRLSFALSDQMDSFHYKLTIEFRIVSILGEHVF